MKTVVPPLALLASSAGSSAFTTPSFGTQRAEVSLKMSAVSSKPNIEVVTQPDKDFLERKGVFSWGTWGCDVSKFPWNYDENESCYLLKGKVTVTPDDGRPAATFGAGDFVTFPAGMSCHWDVSEPVHKHFCFF